MHTGAQEALAGFGARGCFGCRNHYLRIIPYILIIDP